MAMQIRSDLDLPTLRILLDPARTSFSEVVFQVVRGRGTPSEVTRCSLRDLGLPDTLTGMNPIVDNSLTVPAAAIAALKPQVDNLGPSPMPPQSALWLEFPSPRGYLYIIPWERLLEPLGRSLFRLPNHLVRPQAPGQTLEVAICASAPMAKAAFGPPDIVVGLTQHYLKRTGHEVTVHVFTDQAWYYPMQGAVGPFGSQVVVHDPADSIRFERPERSNRVGSSAQVVSPWLLWIREAMKGRPLDLVHFVSHGYLSGDRGAIAVASTPTLNTDRQWARFIGGVELSTFLSQVGAWGLLLTGPPNNFSEAGLRELADSIALVRPGITVTHDYDADGGCAQFGLILQTVLAPGSPLDHPLPATTCWVHPRFVEFPDAYDNLHLNVDGSSAFISGATKEALGNSTTQSWVASASRYLEGQQIKWLPDNLDDAADPAAVTALKNVADLVERHVSRVYPSGDSSAGAS